MRRARRHTLADKLHKRDLQGPDKFQKEAGGVFDWMHEHPKEVAMGGAGLVALILVIGLAFGGDDRSAERGSAAGADLATALELVDRPVASEGAPPPQGGGQPFAGETEKQQAIAQALTEVRTTHAGTRTATAAALPLADAQFKLGKYDEALALYDEYLKEAPAGAELRFLALEGRAQTLQAQGKTDEAIQAWDRLAEQEPAYKDRALYGKGRLLEKQQKWDEARAAYEVVQKDFANGAMARLAAERLTEINRVHPATPPAATANEGQ
jgi:tetratricopeptide (TPR) repeat protein